ncbi:MAG TPA: AMP-binding protein [bacterium]|nr:AMP-binding protein [bacterium]
MDYLLHHLLLRSAQTAPDKIAVIDPEQTLTYSELTERAGYLVEVLRDLGVQPGDRVAFFWDHTVEQAICILAISAVGGIFVPINRLLLAPQVMHILRDSGAKILITQQQRYQKLLASQNIRSVVSSVLFEEDITGKSTLVPAAQRIENDIAALLYTSGSTGFPKGVMISHKNLLSGSSIVSDYLELTPDDHLLGVMQLSFDYGLNQLITMLDNGGTYSFLTYTLPNQMVTALQEQEITGFAAIPTVWNSLLRSTLGSIELPWLRFITNTGGSMPEMVTSFLRQALPQTKIYLMYGLTEAFRSTYLPPEDVDRKPASIGKPIPDTEIYVINEDGTLCAPGEVGELVHRGPTVSLGYWNKPRETARKFRPNPLSSHPGSDFERVVYSGDLAKFDEEGYLYFAGRKDAMIKSHGVRISPNEVENMILKTGLVREVAAIGVPDQYAEQVIKVFVVPMNTSDHTILQAQLVEKCMQSAPDYMIPRYIEEIEAIPKTPHGKINYPQLQNSQVSTTH